MKQVSELYKSVTHPVIYKSVTHPVIYTSLVFVNNKLNCIRLVSDIKLLKHPRGGCKFRRIKNNILRGNIECPAFELRAILQLRTTR
jgi:hypothetical protein